MQQEVMACLLVDCQDRMECRIKGSRVLLLADQGGATSQHSNDGCQELKDWGVLCTKEYRRTFRSLRVLNYHSYNPSPQPCWRRLVRIIVQNIWKAKG